MEQVLKQTAKLDTPRATGCLERKRLWTRAVDCGERSWRKLSLRTAFTCACIPIPMVVFHMAFTLICFIFICFFSIFFCSRRWAASWNRKFNVWDRLNSENESSMFCGLCCLVFFKRNSLADWENTYSLTWQGFEEKIEITVMFVCYS